MTEPARDFAGQSLDPVHDFAASITALAGDHQRSTAYYGNARTLPGTGRPARVVSRVGFLEGARLLRVAPNPALVSRGEDRAVARVVVQLYGLRSDAARLLDTRPEERNRVVAYGGGTVAPNDLESNAKTLAEVGRMTSTSGPARHFLLNRRGDLVIGAVLDDVTDPAYDDAVVVGVEGALAADATAHAGGRVTELLEVPLGARQVDTFAVLLAKLKAAYPSAEVEIEDPGIAALRKLNFTDGAWQENSPFDHSASDWPAVNAAVAQLGTFDLATEVFDVPGTSRPRTTRAVAEAAVGTADTLGARSVLLGQYAASAGVERSHTMQTAQRHDFFVQRIQRAQAQAQAAGGAAAQVQGVAQVQTFSPPANVDAFVYDFATGRWQSGERLTY